MSIRNLEKFLIPKSIAVIGATDRPGSVGKVLMENILGAGFEGVVYPVNPKYQKISQMKSYPTVAALPLAPDLAIIATPPHTVPSLISELGSKGTKAAVVITAGFGEGGQKQGMELQKAMLEAARPHLLRIIGPNCLGIQIPSAKLNASFGGTTARPGKIAFISQSGAMATAIVDWATGRGIGFSQILSLGDMADVDFGDTLDLLVSDVDSKAILLYVEAITFPRKFMSAARAAARAKPVIVVKAGRFSAGARAATSHTGALAGSDQV
ncbi:MAG: CoA-binding protein, partial [Bdellovibrionales bacterium]